MTQTWHVEYLAPVRADAEGVFVPCADLPEATVGDKVVLSGYEPGEERSGVIGGMSDDDRQRFFRIELD